MSVSRTSKNTYRLTIDGCDTKTVFHSIKAMLEWMATNNIHTMKVYDVRK